MSKLTEDDIKRYNRHIILEDIGLEGQEKIMNSKVLIIGLGGLGSPSALYLAAAGVGTIGIIDSDVVDVSNLQRQVIHFTKDIDRPKVESAKEKMMQINPSLIVNTYKMFVNAANIQSIISEYDFIIDATDNFKSKFLINDACVLERKPFSHGGVLRFDGQTMSVIPGISACYRCVFKNPPPEESALACSRAGILGAIAGMLGTIQAAEALKYISEAGELLTNQLLRFDAKKMDFRKIAVKKDNDCPVCGENPVIKDLF